MKNNGRSTKATFSRNFASKKSPCWVSKSFSFWYWKPNPVCVSSYGCLNICWDWWPNTWRGRDWLSQCLTFPTPWEIVSHPQSCRKNYLPLHSRLRWSFGVLGHEKCDETDFRFLLILTQTTTKNGTISTCMTKILHRKKKWKTKLVNIFDNLPKTKKGASVEHEI